MIPDKIVSQLAGNNLIRFLKLGEIKKKEAGSSIITHGLKQPLAN